MNSIAVLIHDIRSTHNVGSIFRTSDSFGVNKIYISGTTPSPLDKYGRERNDVKKVSLGAEKSVSWEVVKSPVSLINKLKKEGYMVIGIEQDQNSIDYKRVKVKKPVLFIIGNEVNGIDKKIIKLCDVVSEIPMKGTKESLNVSVAFGVAISRMLGV